MNVKSRLNYSLVWLKIILTNATLNCDSAALKFQDQQSCSHDDKRELSHT